MELKELVNLVNAHDFQYMFSEDPRWYNQGADEEKRIKEGLKDYLYEDVADLLKDGWRKERLKSYC